MVYLFHNYSFSIKQLLCIIVENEEDIAAFKDYVATAADDSPPGGKKQAAAAPAAPKPAPPPATPGIDPIIQVILI